jgi:hypothetical protein
MDNTLTPLERAFQLAESGSCDSVDQIKKQLKSEGLSDQQVTGGSLMKQLRDMISKAKAR